MRTIHAITLAMLVVTTGFFSSGVKAQTQTSAQIIAAAPVMEILLDNSDSPALDEAVVARAWPIIEAKLRALPPASIVIIQTVGTAELPPVSLRIRIQQRRTADGASMEEVVGLVRNAVLSFPSKVKAHTIPSHTTSNLIAGLFDASRAINLNSDRNVIVFITDLIENSSLANCYQTFPCKLPKPSFSLPGTELTILGVGFGMPSNREISLVKVWEEYLSHVGLPKPAVLKTKIFG